MQLTGTVEDCDIPAGHEAIVKGRLASKDVYCEGVSVSAVKEVYTCAWHNGGTCFDISQK